MKAILLLAVALSVLASSCGGERYAVEPPAISAPAPAGPKNRTPVMVELFTSEGCSSCPPADRQLAFLENTQPAADARIITLAFHVDYWDGPGWKDRFSSAAFSERQNDYVQRLKLESSYTPEMVVDGRAEFVGSDAGRAAAAIAEAAGGAKGVVNVSLDGANAVVEIQGLPPHEAATVFLATAESNIVTEVKGGENGGRKLSHVSVVRRLEKIGGVSAPEATFRKAVALTTDPSWNWKNLKFVAFVQEDATGRIIGVGQGDVRPPPDRAGN